MIHCCLRRVVISGIIGFLLLGCPLSNDEFFTMKDSDPEKVSLQLQWIPQAQFAGYYVALEKGWYREEGLDVSIYSGGPDVSALELVSAGKRDFGIAVLPDLIVAVEQGKSVISISQIQQNSGLQLITRKNSGIAGPKDFVGKKIGVWLGSREVQFRTLMAQQHIPLKRLEIISQGWNMQPFIDGLLDVASSMSYNEYYSLMEAGVKESDLNVIDYSDYNLDFPGDVLFTSKKMIKNSPDICSKMVRATLRGWRYAIDHQIEAVDIILRYGNSKVLKRGHQRKMMIEIARLVEDRQFGKIDHSKLVRLINRLRRYNILKKPLRPNDIFTSDFILHLQ